MSLKINFTDVKETSGETIPAGKYLVAITGWEVRDVKNPKGEAPEDPKLINWEFTLQPTGNANVDKFAGRKVWTNTTLYGGGLGRLKNLFKAVGVSLDGEADLGQLIPSIMNKQVIASIRVRPAQGEYRESNEVSGFSAASDGVPNSSGSNSLLPG